SRRRHTRSTRDWSSDVCSSDLVAAAERGLEVLHDVELVRTILVNDRQRAIRVRREHVARGGIERRTIHPGADWRSGDDSAGLVEIGRASCRERVKEQEVGGAVG